MTNRTVFKKAADKCREEAEGKIQQALDTIGKERVDGLLEAASLIRAAKTFEGEW